METTELTAAELRGRMHAKRVRVTDLAREARLPQPTVSAILACRGYCGEARMRRIGEAIVKLGLDKEPEPDASPVRFRITPL